jgi:hypothetical protein
VADHHPESDLLPALNTLLEANDKLNTAIDATRKAWKLLPEKCWVDRISEPTPLLEKHKLCRVEEDEDELPED